MSEQFGEITNNGEVEPVSAKVEETLAQIMAAIKSKQPDAILIDSRMPPEMKAELLSIIERTNTRITILGLTDEDIS